MAKIIVSGDTSGSVTLEAPAIAGNTTLTLPTTSGTIVTTAGATTVQFAAGSAASPSITFTGDTNTGIFSPAADTIAFTEGGVESMRLDSNGNLGLGVTPNTWTLGKSISVGDVGSAVFGFGGYSALGSGAYFNSGWKYSSSSSSQKPALMTASDGGFTFSYAVAGTAGNAISFSEAMRIDSSGNVGIGTTSPLDRLDVVSGSGTYRNRIRNSGANEALLLFQNSSTGTTTVDGFLTGMGGGGEGYLWNWENQPIQFGTNGTERMRITSSGDLLVGTTTGQSSRIVTQADGTSTYGLTSNMTAASGTRYHCIFRESNTERGSITSNGSATAYNTSSDYRLKENIAPMTGALAKITQLKPCTYIWKSNGSIGQGFIAHELAEVVPDAVTGEKDAVDAKGNPVYQGIDTSFLVATLTAAIQELNAKVEAQAAEIAALKGAN